MKPANRCIPATVSLWALILVTAMAMIMPQRAAAQTISTFAGGETGLALDSRIDPIGLSIDGAGNIYIADNANHRVRKVTPAGAISTIAGTGVVGYSGEGQASRASLNSPQGVALDSAGNLYIADGANNRIRKVTPAGIISTVAGNGTAGAAGDGGPATSANLNSPSAVIASITGDLYIADRGNHKIRRVFSDGNIATYAGTGVAGFSGDGGAATAAQLSFPNGMAITVSGTLYVSEIGNDRIRRITSSGTISTFAGNGVQGFGGDGGPATSASLANPAEMAFDAAGNLYVADAANHRIRRISPAGTILTVAGTGTQGFSGDGGLASAANLSNPNGLAIDGAGNLVISDYFNNRVRVVNSAGIINTVAGGSNFIFGVGDGGSATGANLKTPTAVAFDAGGNLYIADENNHRVRKVTPDGTISTIAGNGTAGSTGDGGAATSATLDFPDGVAVDSSGNIYVSEAGGQRIRKVTPAGIISTYAGTGAFGFGGDGGPATSALLNTPLGLAVDSAGNLYIADYGNNRIRRVSTTGTITTVAGTGMEGFSGDGGLATLANIARPYGVGVDAAGNVWIADTFNNRIRRVSTAGIITTVAGTGVAGFSGDGGSALAARIFNPASVKFDTAGNAFFADASNQRVRKITAAGVISTVAGNGIQGYSGDGGPANAASFNLPLDAALDASGNVYIPDNNNRVRKVTNPSISRVTNDLSNDGKSDIVYRSASGTVGVAIMSGVTAIDGSEILPAGSGWTATHIADTDGDGKADIILRNADGRAAVLIMNGKTVTLFVPLLSAGSGWTVTHAADLNGDGKADLVLKNIDGRVALLIFTGTGTFVYQELLPPGSIYTPTHMGDLNGDGKADMVLRGSDGSALLLAMNGATATSAAFLLPAGSPWSVSHVADLSGDGKADIIIKNTDGSAATLVMDGLFAASANLLLTAGSPYTVTHTGDFNGDGKADILLKNTADNSVVILLMNGGTVSAAAFLLTPGTSFTITQVADYNGDGKSDVFARASDGSGYAITLNGFTVLSVGNVWGAGTVTTVP